MSGKGFWDVMSVIATTVLLIFLLFFALFMFTQTVTYKIKFLGLLRNSFLFSIGVIFQNAIFIGITILPIYLTMSLSGIFGMIFIMLYMFIGISLTILIWTLYAHWVFDRFLNEKVEGAIKDRGIYRKNKEEIAAKREDERKRQEKARYVNPKKKTKKSISEGKSYTPLESTFSRADLEKLNKEKQEVKKEIDEEDIE
jgi:signal transduction histidine kinase